MGVTKAKQTHTAGALRAGRNISAHFRRALPNLPASNELTLAEIISIETGDREMLEALEGLLTLAEEGPEAGFEEPLEIMAKAQAAIRKAKGEL